MAKPLQKQPLQPPARRVLQIVHRLPERVRLRWPEGVDGAELEALCGQLAELSWLKGLQRRDSSRSLVLLLEPDCPPSRWQAALAALGWPLEEDTAVAPTAEESATGEAWGHLSRQMGGGMIGATLGQVLVGGGLATAGAVVVGPPAALVFGGLGAVFGAVAGSIAGSAIADGRADSLPNTLGQLSWRRLSTRVGEEAGSRSGMALGSAVAGPVGAVAGLAVGSMLGGQLATDLTGPASRRAVIGQGRWFAAMVQDTSGESLSESLAARLGAGLTGGSEVGRELGASLGHRFGGRIDWSASAHQHHLVPLSATSSSPAAAHAARREGSSRPSTST